MPRGGLKVLGSFLGSLPRCMWVLATLRQKNLLSVVLLLSGELIGMVLLQEQAELQALGGDKVEHSEAVSRNFLMSLRDSGKLGLT